MKHLSKYLFRVIITVFVVCSQVSFAQDTKVDSLENLIKTDKPDTNKVVHLNILSKEYRLFGDYNNH